MEKRGVYVVRYSGHDDSFTVLVGEKTMPMDEFLGKHTPIQVTSLTHAAPGSHTHQFIGLMIADENEKPRKPVKATQGS